MTGRQNDSWERDFRAGAARGALARRRDVWARALVVLLLGAACAGSGCKSMEDHKCCLFSEDGLFGWRAKSQVEKGTKEDEKKAIERASIGTSNRKEAWEPLESEVNAAKNAGIDLKDYVWSTQRPNGGALFPQKWVGPGPALVVEPASISAPVGSDVIVVASYIGEDSEYLRTGEKLNWNISGVGQFLESNPGETPGAGLFTGEYEGCLDCPLLKKSKKIDFSSATTTTTSQLWHINRGTESRLDDVTVLRGQSWTSVSASEEGTSNVVVMSNTIGNWDKRRAVAQIHWVDAAFKYPQSGIGMVNSTTTLTTNVIRRSTAEPREGWLVRYDVLGGDAALGPQAAKSVLVTTDATGNATVSLSQILGNPGTAKLQATVFRPATDRDKQVEIDKRTFFYTWTYAAPVTFSVRAPEQYVPNQNMNYQLVVNNLSDFKQEVVIEMVIPKGTTLLPPVDRQRHIWSQEADDKSWVRWDLKGINAHDKYVIPITTRRESTTPAPLHFRIVSSKPLAPDAGGPSSAPQAVTPQQSAPQQSAPLTSVPPAESPSPSPVNPADAANTAPSLQ